MPTKPSECHRDRPHYAFGKCRQCYLKWYEQQPGNKRRRLVKTKSWRARNGERVAGYHKASGARHERSRILRQYGITGDEYDLAVIRQDGKCAICGNGNGDRKLVIDHCHKTRRFRSLLCVKCNSALGLLNEDITLFQRCIRYLRRHSCQSSTYQK